MDRTAASLFLVLTLPGIHYLRTVLECERIKHEAIAGRRAVVVGMGFIGCEVAASLTELGVDVTAIFPGRYPLARALGEEVGGVIGAFHRQSGVRMLAGAEVAALAGTKRLEAVVTADGNRVACDFAVAGVGDNTQPTGGGRVANCTGERGSGRRAMPDQRARRLRGRRRRQPSPPHFWSDPGRALQQRREAGSGGGEVDARLAHAL